MFGPQMFSTSISFNSVQYKYGKRNCLLVSPHLLVFYVLVIASAIPISSCFNASSFLIRKNYGDLFAHHAHNQVHARPTNRSFLVTSHEFEADFDEIEVTSISDRDMIMIGRRDQRAVKSSQTFLISDHKNQRTNSSFTRKYSLLRTNTKTNPSTLSFTAHKPEKHHQQPSFQEADQLYVDKLHPESFVITSASKKVIYTSRPDFDNSLPATLVERPLAFQPVHIMFSEGRHLVAFSSVEGSSQLAMWQSSNFGETWSSIVQDGVVKLRLHSITDSIQILKDRVYFLLTNKTSSQAALTVFDLNTRETIKISENALAFDLSDQKLFYLNRDNDKIDLKVFDLAKQFKNTYQLDRLKLTSASEILDFKVAVRIKEDNSLDFLVNLVHSLNGQVKSELIAAKKLEVRVKTSLKDLILSNSTRNIGIHIIKDHDDYIIINTDDGNKMGAKYALASAITGEWYPVKMGDSKEENINFGNFENLNKIQDEVFSTFKFGPNSVLLASKFGKVKNQIDGVYYNLPDHYEWTRVLDGHYFYEYSAEERMIIAAEATKPTNEFIFTKDLGTTWSSHKFTDSTELIVKGLVHNSLANSVTLFCHDAKTSRWVFFDVKLSENAQEDDNDDDNDDDDDDDNEDPKSTEAQVDPSNQKNTEENSESQESTDEQEPPTQKPVEENATLFEKISDFTAKNKNVIVSVFVGTLLLIIIIALVHLIRRWSRSKLLAKKLEIIKYHHQKHRERCLWRRGHDHGMSLNCFSKFTSGPHLGLAKDKHRYFNADGIDPIAQNNLAFFCSSTAIPSSNELPPSTYPHDRSLDNYKFDDYHPLI